MYKYLISLLLALPVCALAQMDRDAVVDRAEQQTTILLDEAVAQRSGDHIFPRTLDRDTLKLVPSNDWTSGFFAGNLWLLYQLTGKEKWKQDAIAYTALMQREQFNGNSHDVGFKIYCSYGNGFRLTGDTSYRGTIIRAAHTLATRFNPQTGCIKSWSFGKGWQFPVIIDNMMNLELLFAATRLSGDSSFYRIAVSHANQTLANHFRKDHSSYHVVDYDSVTGKVIKRITFQGYANESSWARGQAWALYGFTMCYRETRDPRYLQQAIGVADYILHHPSMPRDHVPYWDFNAPDIPNAPRDASAAAVTASALYELSTMSRKARRFRHSADAIMKSLTTHYLSGAGQNKGFLLEHSTGFKPAGSEIDAPIIYADYYYLEALIREGGR